VYPTELPTPCAVCCGGGSRTLALPHTLPTQPRRYCKQSPAAEPRRLDVTWSHTCTCHFAIADSLARQHFCRSTRRCKVHFHCRKLDNMQMHDPTPLDKRSPLPLHTLTPALDHTQSHPSTVPAPHIAQTSLPHNQSDCDTKMPTATHITPQTCQTPAQPRIHVTVQVLPDAPSC
jgi:hypothetical protein